MKRWQTPRKKPKKPPFGQRRMPRAHHPRERVRKRRAAYLLRVVRRVEIMWAGWHDRGFLMGHNAPKRVRTMQEFTSTFGAIS